jgi:tetratricopeptide (TPR) repeat protein
MEGLAQGGGICISGTVFDQIETKVDLECAFLGQQRVKNISKPIRVYEVLLQGGAETGPEESPPQATGTAETGQELGDRVLERREPHSVFKETLTFFKDQFKEHLTEAQLGGGRHSRKDRIEMKDRSGQTGKELLAEANRLIRQTTRKANRQARRLYQRALKLDPESAEALTGLGWTYFVEWPHGWSQSEEPLARAGDLAKEAIRLKPDLFLAQLLLAWVHLWRQDYVLALAQGTKLLDRKPDSADAQAFMAYALAMSGLSAKAGGLVDRARSRRPRHPLFHSFYLGVVCFHLGRLEEAQASLDLALQRQSNFLVARVVRAMVYVEQGLREEAKNEIKAIKKLAPDYSLEMALQRCPHKDPADLNRCRKNLRQAGLK